MNRALTPSRVEAAFWLIITVGLAAGIGLESKWGYPLLGPAGQGAETSPAFAKPELAEPFQLAGPDQFLDITLRPLFLVTRRPVPAAPTADSKPSMKKDQFILMGTSIVAENKFAFLLEKAGNRSRVVAVGKEINGITVKDIAADRVVLSQYDDTEVLLLKMNRPAPGIPALPGFAPAGLPAGAAAGRLLPPGVRPTIPAPPVFAPAPKLPSAVAPVVSPPQPTQPQTPSQTPAPAGVTIGPR